MFPILLIYPNALAAARKAYAEGKLKLNLGHDTAKWMEREGWPFTTRTGWRRLFGASDWTEAFKLRAIQTEESLHKATQESGADLFVPQEMFDRDKQEYIV